MITIGKQYILCGHDLSEKRQFDRHIVMDEMIKIFVK